MFLRSLAGCLLLVVVGCSSNDEVRADGGGSSVGGNGGIPGGGTGADGSAGGPTGGNGDLDGGSTGPADGGAMNVSRCGAPLDTIAPTAASIVNDGPYPVASYSTGLPSSTLYKSLTVFYPSAPGPFVVVMVSPGLTEILEYLQPWATRFASYGYVAVFVEANDTSADSEAMRADGMWAAIASIKGENTRAGSPLMGKLSSCIVTSGHSLGGGASLSIANAHPNDVKGALGFNPYDGTTIFSSVVAPTLILTGQNDPTAPPAQHGRRQYDSMSASITKEYVEISGGDHQAALLPATIPGQYAVSWIKFTVDGDARYRPFLDEAATGLSDFATTLP